MGLGYVRLSLGGGVDAYFGGSCRICLPSVHFVAAWLCLSVFPFGVGGLGVDLIVLVPEFIYLFF